MEGGWGRHKSPPPAIFMCFFLPLSQWHGPPDTPVRGSLAVGRLIVGQCRRLRCAAACFGLWRAQSRVSAEEQTSMDPSAEYGRRL
jgi:hypothetical protein